MWPAVGGAPAYRLDFELDPTCHYTSVATCPPSRSSASSHILSNSLVNMSEVIVEHRVLLSILVGLLPRVYLYQSYRLEVIAFCLGWDI